MRADGPAREWNREGSLIVEREFRDGVLID
jgi:hypothetical protein